MKSGLIFSSENGGYVKSASLDTALLEKLQNIAEHLREAEGWSWCDGRLDPISHYGKDTKIWRLHAVPPWNIPKTNQNVLRSWKLWKLSMKTRTPA
jgi:hypothetical protein